jgi:hypothetical protein
MWIEPLEGERRAYTSIGRSYFCIATHYAIMLILTDLGSQLTDLTLYAEPYWNRSAHAAVEDA